MAGGVVADSDAANGKQACAVDGARQGRCRMKAAKQPPTRDEIIAAAKLAAFLNGCTCNAHVRLQNPQPGVYYAEVAHDAWCGHPSQQRGRDA